MVRSGLLLSSIHLFLVVLVFLIFGLGLEGKHSIGHDILWLLLMPGTWLTFLPWYIVLPLNSLFWGFTCASLYRLSH